MSTKCHRLLLTLAILSLCGCGPSASERQAKADLAKSQAEATALRQRLTDTQNDLASAQAKILALQEDIKKSRPAPEYVVSGEIFITTRGGNSIKLGGVPIFVLDRASVDECINARNKVRIADFAKLEPALARARRECDEAEKAWTHALDELKPTSGLEWAFKKKQEARDKLVDVMREIGGAAQYFKMMPPALVSAKTNSDGKYRVSVPRSVRVVLAAFATRAVIDKTEHYYWLLPLDPPSGDAVEVVFSNDNLTSVNDGGSLIYTTD